MKQRSVLLIFVFIFWTIFFVIARGIFLLYFDEARSALSFPEVLAVFKYGLSMDLSMAAYLTAFTGIVLAFLYFNTGIQLWPFWIAFQTAALIAASLVIVYDLATYSTWQYRLDVRALTEIDMQLINRQPEDVIILLAIFLVLVGVSFFANYRIFWPRFYSLRATSLATMPVILALTAILILPMRGSLGVVTMNPSFAYSHPTNIFANHAGVNVNWNFANSLWWRKPGVASTGTNNNPLTEAIFAQPDSTTKLINHQRPNIVIILLDRLPADLVGVMGGRADVTPNFNALSGEGILFDQFYSNSNQTDKGLAAILNGYPSQSRMSTMSDTRRAQGLPYLNKVFKSQGYTTGFTHGGWPNYNNLRAYLFAAGFDSVTHANNFVTDRRSGKWGVPDEFVFEKFSDEIFHDRQPFFRVMMTSSTRAPYEVPLHTAFKGNEESTKFLNAVHYTDDELGTFIEQAKKTLWWDNTLIIVTSDQGNVADGDQQELKPEQFKIPMLWLGGALATRDTVIHTLGNQTDICNTLLAQIGQYSKEFAFSRDIVSTNAEQLAMFVFDNGYGVVKPYGAGIFDIADDKVIYSERVNKREAEQGRAYINAVKSDYASR
ncbi:MAG: sulfatase-like hydrolase/transferase [Chryseolinea sp.]